jgi:DNA-binding IclR family transcriptional regulator
LPDAEVDRVVQSLPAYTHRTVTSRRALKRELADVRAQGFSLAVDELEIGLAAMAAPIRNAHGDVIASLSLSGPTFRLDDARIKEVLPLLTDAADEVSHRLGWGAR